MYWKGLLVAIAFDVAWIMGNPSLVTGPETHSPVPVLHAPDWVMNQAPGGGGGVTMQTSPEDAGLDAAGRLEDSLMVHLQTNDRDAAAMVSLARMYVAHGWYDAAIGPLARAAQLDPERRGIWSLLDRALKMSGKAQITDAELTKRAQQFVERVAMWGDHC